MRASKERDTDEVRCRSRGRCSEQQSAVLSSNKGGRFVCAHRFGQCCTIPWATGVLQAPASVQRQKQNGRETLARPALILAAESIFYRPSTQNIAGGSRKCEICLCRRSDGCRGCCKVAKPALPRPGELSIKNLSSF